MSFSLLLQVNGEFFHFTEDTILDLERKCSNGAASPLYGSTPPVPSLAGHIRGGDDENVRINEEEGKYFPMARLRAVGELEGLDLMLQYIRPGEEAALRGVNGPTS